MRETNISFVKYSVKPVSKSSLVAACIGCVNRDQKVPGSNHVRVAKLWTYTSGA